MPAQSDDSADPRRRVLEKVASEQIRFVNLQFTDIMGAVKSVAEAG